MLTVGSTFRVVWLLQILCSAFLAILFLQSGIDKIVDRRGNLDWLKGHFAKSPLAGIVPAMVTTITILEIAAGALSAIGCVVIILSRESTLAFYGAVGYAALLAVAVLGLRPRLLAERRVTLALAALATVGVAFSLYLTYLELFVIHATCRWCVGSAVIVTAIWVVALSAMRRSV